MAAADAAAAWGLPPVIDPQSCSPFYVLAQPAPPQAFAASFDSFSGVPPQPAGGNSDAIAARPPPTGPVFDLAAAAPRDAPTACGRLRGHLRSSFEELACDVWSDHRNYYDCATMRNLWLGVALAAVPANTSLDDDFHGWYQRDVRSPDTDNFASFWKAFGEGQIFIPAYAGLALVGGLLEDRPLIGPVGEFSSLVSRGYLVGTPPMLLMQFLLGGSRPGECGVESQWKPFDDNNAVSGHAFVGAVPFITAAMMCDRPLLKATLYTLSTFTAWSRINDDAHYLSQACLGWWMAYLACQAVNDTELADRCYALAPLLTPEMTGLALVVRR